MSPPAVVALYRASMAELLLIDDDRAIRTALSLALRRSGHQVRTAATGEDGIAAWRRDPPDLVLLDVMLPRTTGLDVCRAIREHGSTPVVMLTARDDPIDIVLGLEMGADDYVTKPVEPRVLDARIRAILRRAEFGSRTTITRVGDLCVDRTGMRIERNGEEVHLTPTERRLLLAFVARPGQVFTRELLLEQVWEYDHMGDCRLVDTAVQRLRAKIETDPKRPELITTVRGIGYRLDPPS